MTVAWVVKAGSLRNADEREAAIAKGMSTYLVRPGDPGPECRARPDAGRILYQTISRTCVASDYPNIKGGWTRSRVVCGASTIR